MPELLIHIGYHKTGSSWLQKFVFSPKAKAGFHCFDKGSAGPINQRLIAPHGLDFDAEVARRHFEILIKDVEADGLRATVSSERLSGHPFSGGHDSKELADRLAQVFPLGRVLIVIREQRSIVLSAYRQYIKAGGTFSVERWVGSTPESRARVPTFDPDHFSYHRLIRLYEHLFGSDRVQVLPYELLLHEPQAFVAAVASFADVGLKARFLDGLPTSQRPNLGYTATTTRLKRVINRLVVRSDVNPSPLLAVPSLDAFSRRHVHRVDAVVPAAIEDRLARRARAAVAATLGDHFRESNRATAAMTGLDLARYDYVL